MNRTVEKTTLGRVIIKGIQEIVSLAILITAVAFFVAQFINLVRWFL